MEKLETLIQELYQEGTREKNMEVLSHIRKLAKEEKQFIIPVGDANGEKVYRRLSLDDGQDVFVAFTTQAQVDLGQTTETLNQSVMDVLHMVHDTQGVSGVVLNPWKDSYFLPKVLIEMILDNKNLESEIKVVKGDITTFDGDCIVNAANESLLGGGGVDGAIHRAAGRGLLEECRRLNGCRTGEAKITGGYNLPAKYVIHTVGPIWRGGKSKEKELLQSCYREALKLAVANNCESVAFPLISAGAYGYPKDEALAVAVKTVGEFLLHNDISVYIALFEAKPRRTEAEILKEVSLFLGKDDFEIPLEKLSLLKFCNAPAAAVFNKSMRDEELERCLAYADESFSQMLLRKIDEKGMTDVECYRAANVDRRLFSKIRGDKNYKPKKQTAVAFAVALKLTLDETEELLEKAGFALSPSQPFDIIVEYYISRGIYDICEINLSLYKFDQLLLGGANVA